MQNDSPEQMVHDAILLERAARVLQRRWPRKFWPMVIDRVLRGWASKLRGKAFPYD